MPNKFTNTVKLITFILIIPAIYTATWSFNHQIRSMPMELGTFFMLGIAAYVAVHLFVINPKGLFRFGQGFVSKAFRVFPKAEGVLTLILPFYTLVIVVLIFVNSLTLQLVVAEQYLLFAVGFSLAMHLVQTAEGLRSSDHGGEVHYYFTFGLTYLGNVMMISILLSVMYPEFSFGEFFKMMGSEAGNFYNLVFSKLFVV